MFGSGAFSGARIDDIIHKEELRNEN